MYALLFTVWSGAQRSAGKMRMREEERRGEERKGEEEEEEKMKKDLEMENMRAT